MKTARWKFISPLALLALAATSALPAAWADSCTTQAQMTATQRTDFTHAATMLVSDVQNGDVNGLRSDTLPAVAADFTGIANSAEALKPEIAQAELTVDALFAFEATPPAAGAQSQGNQFFCSPAGSTMTVVLNFSGLPAGKYALAILHATGVPKPQQIALILAQDTDGRWKLAGISSKPLMLAGHNGLWYWSQGREYAAKRDEWAAHFYYQIATFLVVPADYLSSPNVDKLRREDANVHAQDLPGDQPATVNANGLAFQLTRVDTSAELGPLDLTIHYNPNAQEAAQLRDPVAARKQVMDLMSGILAMHPGLRTAFHGLWVYADSGSATVFALELPMDQIPGGGPGGGNSLGR
ncbi:MAG: hypothetical protein WA414_03585 [Acidobacteriaceae bacterium]